MIVFSGCSSTSEPKEQKKESSQIYMPNDSIERVTETCKRGVAEACADLAQRFASGTKGAVQDLQKVLELGERACDLGDAVSCNRMGALYGSADQGRLDLRRAARFREKACNLKRPEGCYNLAVMHSRGEGVAVDKKRALELYRRACEEDHAAGCHNAGVLERGDGHAETAKRLFDRACALGNKDSCET
jgi:uncharacterized protein